MIRIERGLLMNAKTLALLAALALPALAEESRSVGTALGKYDAERQAASLLPVDARLAMWIWSDKYVYQQGEQLTLRWTVKPNNDRYPYTIVAYRQNNQNGRKFYVPAGNETPTDIFGNTVSQGFQPTVLAAAEKRILLGAGGLLGGAVTIPAEFGMHTIVVELRDYTGTRIIQSRYMKIGVVEQIEDLRGVIDSARTLTNNRAYRVNGVVTVRNVTLTIQPGTFIIGAPGSQPPSLLLITRSARLVANGTRSRPIVMTSSRPFGERQRGDWGGLIVLGRAPVNTGANTGGGTNNAGEFFIEGLPRSEDTIYGGNDPTHDCGSLRYVRVEYAGSIFSPNNEANSFTWGGCGNRTVSEYLQAIYGLDDSFEWFGGTNDGKYLIGGLGADDFLDFQLGWTGRVQFGIFYQSPNDRGNRCVEGDNSEFNQAAEPYSNPVIYNITCVGSGQPGFDEGNSPGLFLRRGSRGSINNAISTNFWSAGAFVDGTATQAQIDNGQLSMNGVLLWDNNLGSTPPGANTLAGQVDAALLTFAQGTRGNGRNFLVQNPRYARAFEYSDPDWRGLFGSPIFRAGWVSPPNDGFFDQSARFIGGVGDDAWWEEWTSFLQESDIRP
jgi:hypothetical protein